MSLTTKTVKNIGYSSLVPIMDRLLRLTVIVYLAHLLDPTEFAIVGLAWLLLDNINVLANFGIEPALVQAKDNEDKLDTGISLRIIFSSFLFLFTLIFAPYWSDLFGESDLVLVTQILAITILLDNLILGPRVILTRALNFKIISFVKISSNLTRSLTVLLFAYYGYSYWSIVFGAFAGRLISILLFYYFSPYIPKFILKKDKAKQIINYGKHILLSNIIIILYFTIDKAIIGEVLGLTALGYYLMSFRWANFATVQITQMISGVVFPTFSRINDDTDRLRNGYLRVLRYTCLVILPLILGIYTVSDIFVEVVLTDKWLPVIVPLQLLCITSLFRSLGSTAGNIFMATANPKILSIISILQLLTVILLMRYSLQIEGLIGGVKLLMIVEIIGVLVAVYFMSKIINLSIFDILNTITLLVIASILMVVIVTYAKTQLAYNFINLCLLIILGMISYFFFVITLSRGKIFYEIKNLVIKH